VPESAGEGDLAIPTTLEVPNQIVCAGKALVLCCMLVLVCLNL
jgi:hypothetical protein